MKLYGYTLNKYKRIQKGFCIAHMFPRKDDGICDCGCGRELPSRNHRWYDKECNARAYCEFRIILGDRGYIREILFIRDSGYCAVCHHFDKDWQADHIIPVYQGGGACTLDNFQTLCPSCHVWKGETDRIKYLDK